MTGASGPDAASDQGHRRTIAVLSDHISIFHAGYEGRLRQALHRACRERDLNVIFTYGHALGGNEPSRPAHNSIFDLIHRDRVDGVILFSSILAANSSDETLQSFAARFAPFPACSLGVAVPILPSITVDNRPGMAAVVEHLVVQHGRRRFAFLAGHPNHPEADLRFGVFRDVLARHGIPFDEALMAYGAFVTHRGRAAMEEILARGQPFDAVVSANDSMAIGALEALRQHGLSVPEDVALSGFDDLIHARLGNPPLTTVAQPLEALATRSLELVLEQAQGRPVPTFIELGTELVLRQSCGCPLHSLSMPPITPRRRMGGLAYVRSQRSRLKGQMALLLTGFAGGAEMAADRLLQGLELEIDGHPGSLRRAVRLTLAECRGDVLQHRGVGSVISFLSVELSGLEMPGFESVWADVHSELVLAATASHLELQLDLDHSYGQLLGSTEHVFGSLKSGSLQPALQKSLPLMGIRTAVLSRFSDDSTEHLECFASLFEDEQSLPVGLRFPARLLYPHDTPWQKQRHTCLVLPLVFETRCLGVAAFEYSESTIGYQLLGDQISAALGSAMLERELVHQMTLRERSIQERLAATQRMESLRVLAGGVAHDLNNLLGPLVALPDLMIAQLVVLDGPRNVIDELVVDLETFRVAGLRASQIITDLLTLSRQGRTAKMVVELNRLLAECAAGYSEGRARDPENRVRLVVVPSPEPITIQASETHVLRSISNLVRNAMDAIEGDGEVTLRASAVRLLETKNCFEAIPPGEYATVEVIDTGRGMREHDRTRIFEPFFSTKRLSSRSGTGLGLAIVHGVVKEHEGFIDVVSALGRGTTFTLYFPRARERVLEEPPRETPSRGRGRILVIDDEPVQLRTCRRVLTRLGYQVDALESGEQALSVFEQAVERGSSPYDLVILDVLLNEQRDGLEIYEQICSLFPRQLAVLVSGHAPTERVELAVERGLPWLPKPYTAEALATAVQSTLEGRSSATVIRLSSRPGR